MVALLNAFCKKDFINRGRDVFSAATLSVVKKNLKKLEIIAAKIDASEEMTISKDMVAELRRKIVGYIQDRYRDKAQDPFSIKDRRLMCYFAGDIVNKEVDYSNIAFVIEKGWADRYIGPLLRLCLNKWNSVNDEVIPMYNLFIDKLKAYNGPQVRYREWKDNIKFFKTVKQGKQDGAVLLGKELRASVNSPADFQSRLDIAKDLFHSEYFQTVIRTFYMVDNGLPDSLEFVLDEHGVTDTNLIVLSDFIHKANRATGVRSERLKLQSMVLRKIGHPSIASKWKLFNMDARLQPDIDSARMIVNNWLVQDYINEIFSTLIDDPRRRNFWIKYSKQISDVKVIGPQDGKRILSRIESLKASIDYCFKVTSTNSGAYAFVMTMGKYKFIEFSETGNALYIYKNDYQIDKQLNSVYISSVNTLKQPSLSSMTNSFGTSCRMVHKANNWEWDLESWIRQYVE